MKQLLIIVATAILAGGTSLAQEPHADIPNHDNQAAGKSTMSWGAEADFNYRYVWHGIAFSRGPVLQPSAYISKYDLTFTVWSNVNLNNEPQRGEVTETDLIFGYSRTWEGWKAEAGYYVYLNRPPHGASDPATSEIWTKVSHAAGPVSIFTTHTFDVHSYRGAYYGDAGVGFERKLRRATINSTVSAGWASAKFNETYVGPARSAFNFLGGDFSMTCPLTPHFSVRPHVEVSRIMDNELRRALTSPSVWSAGLAFGADF